MFFSSFLLSCKTPSGIVDHIVPRCVINPKRSKGKARSDNKRPLVSLACVRCCPCAYRGPLKRYGLVFEARTDLAGETQDFHGLKHVFSVYDRKRTERPRLISFRSVIDLICGTGLRQAALHAGGACFTHNICSRFFCERIFRDCYSAKVRRSQ